MFFTCQDQIVTWPLLITDIPYSDSGLQSRRIRFNFYAPNTSAIFKIKLHVMSNTYIGIDWETEMILNVIARKKRRSFKDFIEDESKSGTDRINKMLMDKILLKLPAGASEDEMESKLEVIVAQFLTTKEKKKWATRGKSFLKIQDDKSKDIVKLEAEQSQSADIKAEVKRQAHLLWQGLYGRKPILCVDLEKVIPDTLTTLKKWSEMNSCDPEKDYVSEWKMKWDCEDDNEKNWNDEKDKLGSDQIY